MSNSLRTSTCPGIIASPSFLGPRLNISFSLYFRIYSKCKQGSFRHCRLGFLVYQTSTATTSFIQRLPCCKLKSRFTHTNPTDLFFYRGSVLNAFSCVSSKCQFNFNARYPADLFGENVSPKKET